MMIIPICHLQILAAISLELPAEVWRRLSSETDHELQAALICLLTAALAAQGTAAIIGEPSGGWYWLPPWSLGQQWATQGFTNAARAMASKGQPLEKFTGRSERFPGRRSRNSYPLPNLRALETRRMRSCAR